MRKSHQNIFQNGVATVNKVILRSNPILKVTYKLSRTYAPDRSAVTSCNKKWIQYISNSSQCINIGHWKYTKNCLMYFQRELFRPILPCHDLDLGRESSLRRNFQPSFIKISLKLRPGSCYKESVNRQTDTHTHTHTHTGLYHKQRYCFQHQPCVVDA